MQTVFSTRSVPRCYKQDSLECLEILLDHPVPEGYKYGDLALQVESETVKYGREYQGTRTRERLRCQGPASYTKDRPVLSSERETHTGLRSSLCSLGADSSENAVFVVLAQQYLDCCLLISCRGNLFTESLPSNERLFPAFGQHITIFSAFVKCTCRIYSMVLNINTCKSRVSEDFAKQITTALSLATEDGPSSGNLRAIRPKSCGYRRVIVRTEYTGNRWQTLSRAPQVWKLTFFQVERNLRWLLQYPTERRVTRSRCLIKALCNFVALFM
jgi:hypothetical protein